MENLFWRLLTLAIYAAVMFGIYKLLSAVVHSMSFDAQVIAAVLVVAFVVIGLPLGLWLDRRR